LSNTSPIIYNVDNCTNCLECEQDCPSLSINISQGTINKHCIACGHCVAICKTQAMSFKDKSINLIAKNPITGDDFVTLCRQHRSIRSYKSDKIKDEHLDALLKNMVQYPSSSNFRDCKVTIITNRDIINELVKETNSTLQKTFKLATKGITKHLFNLVITKDESNKIKYYAQQFKKKQDMNVDFITYNAPALIIFHGKKMRMRTLVSDAYIWATYTSLYAKTLGIGSCFIGFIVAAAARNKKINDICKIPQTHILHSCLTIGYSNKEYVNEVSRDLPNYTILN